METGIVNAHKDADQAPPPPVISAPPERELERKLKLNPGDEDAKADVGSDESMDASDPPAAAQPGSHASRRGTDKARKRQKTRVFTFWHAS